MKANMTYSKQEYYRAHLTRDARFNGKFFVAVKTTKIYCRPVCPARKAKLENIEFFLHAAQAEAAGYRPCLRCRPESAPGSAAWLGTSATVKRAIRLMESVADDQAAISQIAIQLGVGERWLRTLFQEQVGINPQAFMLNKKLDLARNLLDNTNMPISQIALSVGFGSIRRFNDAFKQRFDQVPSYFKAQLGHHCPAEQTIYLRYRPPMDWQRLTDFLADRSIPTMEYVHNNCYQRLFTYQGEAGWLQASLHTSNRIKVVFQINNKVPIIDFVARIKSLFDLDADPMLIEHDLQQDAQLAPLLSAYHGLRIPGCWDGFELAVRAIIGQKISVKAARTILIRLVNLYGKQQSIGAHCSLTHVFPTPQDILAADLSGLGLTTAKAQTLKNLAQAVEMEGLKLDGTADYDSTCQQLLSIKGIGPWPVQYIAMRALRDPNAFPQNDLELQKKIKRYELDPTKWAPWRAYAAILLFNL